MKYDISAVIAKCIYWRAVRIVANLQWIATDNNVIRIRERLSFLAGTDTNGNCC